MDNKIKAIIIFLILLITTGIVVAIKNHDA